MADFFQHRPMAGEQAIHWPGGRPKDQVGVPTNPRILVALAKWKCTARVIHNGYDVINQFGDAIELPFAASIEDWEQAAEQVGKHRG